MRLRSLAKLRRLLATSLITLGSLFLANALWPIISYQLFIYPQLKSPRFLAPLPADQIIKILPSNSYFNTSPVFSSPRDYTKLSNWFSEPLFLPPPRASKITHYTLTIPKLKIQNAVVSLDSDDLSQNLIHYPATANPGEFGAPVIFGHSVLRQFYNPNKYSSIFSTLMTLKPGDDIFVNFDGIRYHYQVIDKQIVEPDALDILRQQYNLRGLKLVTCVPEGTYLYRGLVFAQLVSYL